MPSWFPLGVAGLHVRVRIPSQGTVAGDVVRSKQGARISCVEIRRRSTATGLVVDHIGLAEGLTSREVTELQGAWQRKYGEPATPLGAPFALRLPLPLAHASPGVAHLHRQELGTAQAVGHVLSGQDCDLWIACPSALHAEDLAETLRPLVTGLGGSVAVGDPAAADLECWATLRLAAEVIAGA